MAVTRDQRYDLKGGLFFCCDLTTSRTLRSYGSVSKACTPVVHIKIAGKWMFIPLKMVLIGIDPYPYCAINRVDMC